MIWQWIMRSSDWETERQSGECDVIVAVEENGFKEDPQQMLLRGPVWWTLTHRTHLICGMELNGDYFIQVVGNGLKQEWETRKWRQECGHSWEVWLYVGWEMGSPGSSAGKKSACIVGDPSSIPGSGRSPGEGIGYPLQHSWASLVAQMVKNTPAVWETWVWSLGWEDPLEEDMATHSSILAGESPWTEEPGGL